MDIIEEIQKLRTKMITDINLEFDEMILRVKEMQEQERQSESGDYQEVGEVKYEREIPLSVGTGYFKGEKPVAVILPGGERVNISNWKKLVETVMKDCNKTPQNHKKLLELRGKIQGRDRVLLGGTKEKMRSPLEIDNNIYMETHYDTESLLRIMTTRILDAVPYDYSNLKIIIRNG